jgi:3-oxoacyl-[acyl-carrier-protein] synthase III
MDAPKTVSLIDVSTYLPGSPIGADYYLQFQAQGPDSDDLRDNLMFRAPRFRHHVAADETAIDMVERLRGVRAGDEAGPQPVGDG